MKIIQGGGANGGQWNVMYGREREEDKQNHAAVFNATNTTMIHKLG